MISRDATLDELPATSCVAVHTARAGWRRPRDCCRGVAQAGNGAIDELPLTLARGYGAVGHGMVARPWRRERAAARARLGREVDQVEVEAGAEIDEALLVLASGVPCHHARV